jgi:serine/threonine protein kinase
MFDLFKKLDRIGSGGYADVYRAQNIFTNQYVARKELRVASPENRRRFERERDMLKLYGATGGVPKHIYDDLQANPPYIIMELSTLGSLEQFIGQPVDVKRYLRWLIDVAHTVENIHRNKHKHRDIKPSNLLLYNENGRERVKLSDFGIAQRPDTNSSLKTNSPLGTKEYLDPKAVRDNYFYPESDVFALGKTMRELLTGFREPNIFRPIPGPASLTALINSMTSGNLSSRPTPQVIYQTAESILREIEMAEFAAMQAQQAQAPGINWGSVLKATLGVATVLLVANSNTYDENAGRYRNSKGQFQSGWLNLGL